MNTSELLLFIKQQSIYGAQHFHLLPFRFFSLSVYRTGIMTFSFVGEFSIDVYALVKDVIVSFLLSTTVKNHLVVIANGGDGEKNHDDFDLQ